MEIFLDLETLSTQKDAAVWQVGMVLCADSDKVDDEEHSWLVKPSEEAHVSLSTLDWMKNQPELWARFEQARATGLHEVSAYMAIREAVLSFLHKDMRAQGASSEDIHTAIRIKEHLNREEHVVYSWGTFDFPILTSMAKRADMKPFWDYGSECDLRGVVKFLSRTMDEVRGLRPYPDVPHDALSDAIALQKMKITLQYMLDTIAA